ncbi:MAG: NAD(P)-dependent oxidoreductase [Bradyrhizobiaceae bacterium]|nr:MAG: NAD(P)-dependent oxidoreductase [Bradyrhizobiaceae bacterium]
MNLPRKAIVFGGAGFIGSHLIGQLRGDYDEIFCVDITAPRFKTDGTFYVDWDVTKPIPSDLCGPGSADIFNLAAVHTTPGHEDWEYYWTNISGASHVCQFAGAIGCKSLVFTSSISVYGPSEQQKDETSKLEPTSAYGRSKLLAEGIHKLWQSEQPERRLTIVRPAVIFGYTERGNFTRLAGLLRRGRFVYPGRKDTIKSCGYVKELIQSMLYMRSRNAGVETYNFCRPERYTSEEICASFNKVAGYDKPNFVMPMWLMEFAAVPFEVLSAVGFKNDINRERVRKLFNSTNVYPRRLLDAGFEFRYDIVSALADWKAASANFD